MVEVRTARIRRTWLEKLLLWRSAYETKIFDQHREVVGRGPTPEASQKNAEQRWVAELSPWRDDGHRCRVSSLFTQQRWQLGDVGGYPARLIESERLAHGGSPSVP